MMGAKLIFFCFNWLKMQNFTNSMEQNQKNSFRYQAFALIAIVLSVVLFYYQGYILTRQNFEGFIGTYFSLFILFYWLWLNKQNFSFNTFFWISIGFRLVLILSVPALSNDFFRFIWDGELITHGINPYAHRPDDLISYGGFMDSDQMRALYHGMGELSQQNYTCYPPLNQLFFALAAGFSDNMLIQIIALRIIMLLADVGIILVAKKIAVHLNIAVHNIWLYALNPFVILEFTGNLHFEGVMIFFLLCALYLLLKNQWLFSSVFFAFAVQVKLIPLILLPMLFKKLGLRKMIGYTAVTAIVVLLLGKLFLNELFLLNMLGSIDQYFGKFEFNAGIFYIIREIGFVLVGYDTIQTTGPILTKIILISIIMLGLFRKYNSDHDLPVLFMFAFLFFYGFSTTVHPWYISLVLIFSVFTQFKTGVVWSLLVMLSYSAYQHDLFQENAVYLFAEYLTLLAVLIYELRKFRQKENTSLQTEMLLKGHSV